jgi:hypothetical protein
MLLALPANGGLVGSELADVSDWADVVVGALAVDAAAGAGCIDTCASAVRP